LVPGPRERHPTGWVRRSALAQPSGDPAVAATGTGPTWILGPGAVAAPRRGSGGARRPVRGRSVRRRGATGARPTTGGRRVPGPRHRLRPGEPLRHATVVRTGDPPAGAVVVCAVVAVRGRVPLLGGGRGRAQGAQAGRGEERAPPHFNSSTMTPLAWPGPYSAAASRGPTNRADATLRAWMYRSSLSPPRSRLPS
jgi:hypothetical protein